MTEHSGAEDDRERQQQPGDQRQEPTVPRPAPPEFIPPPPDPPLAEGSGRALSSGVSVARRSTDERRAMLAQQLQQAAARGLRLESQTEFQAVLIEGKPINHTLHAILTIFTCLIWGIVWAVIAATGGEKRHQLVVDEFGNVHWQNLGKV